MPTLKFNLIDEEKKKGKMKWKIEEINKIKADMQHAHKIFACIFNYLLYTYIVFRSKLISVKIVSKLHLNVQLHVTKASRNKDQVDKSRDRKLRDFVAWTKYLNVKFLPFLTVHWPFFVVKFSTLALNFIFYYFILKPSRD